METDRELKKIRAKKRVEELKGFYVHLMAYLCVNTFISVMKIVNNIGNGETIMEGFWDFGTFAVWLFWGVGLVFHGLKVFSYNPFFGKDWEKRQIEKFMEEDRSDAERFNQIRNGYEK